MPTSTLSCSAVIISTYRVTDHCKQQEIHHNRWDDFTPDLWAEGNLKYLRDIALPFDEGEFVYDPGEDCFGFQKDYQKNNMQEEDFIFYVDEDIGNTGEVIGTEGISEETNELTEPGILYYNSICQYFNIITLYCLANSGNNY